MDSFVFVGPSRIRRTRPFCVHVASGSTLERPEWLALLVADDIN
ncbi:hypothetical protein CES85_3787 (plasmid) [Ochrobactrum quorumnocens]|uniref:Uncharacterized protein n=1 Tax=Ochrobactrum quorumnocens TaxID=271865 RepID=A0A248UQC9_9HYPH|nr:hypothetical protein CES85_3787 [[Ochrobactrum] quorumnocens]